LIDLCDGCETGVGLGYAFDRVAVGTARTAGQPWPLFPSQARTVWLFGFAHGFFVAALNVLFDGSEHSPNGEAVNLSDLLNFIAKPTSSKMHGLPVLGVLKVGIGVVCPRK
jgi:hypothetical protein